MALWNYGHKHGWFAWHPVRTCCGWIWLRKVSRYRVYLGASMPGAAEWWGYDHPDCHIEERMARALSGVQQEGREE
ncbi:hypothetical protein FGL91_18735 [Microbacterium sp. CBA3102]|uniref:hypothetical protein n=1 Tax=Microbacterium sp. CBA3102 TaxID=2603598 RepID=UPI0011BB3E73|nr:hypothetical protein [Microbacterium sp. CBA3102]QEA30404.1 hypothetical protein FGL91_18735 [Microbacterium sp. CBA3102]